MSQCKNPFKRHRFPRETILMAVCWYCCYSLSCQDVRDMLAERGVTVDQFGQMIDFRLTVRHNANAKRAFLWQARETGT